MIAERKANAIIDAIYSSFHYNLLLLVTTILDEEFLEFTAGSVAGN